jgi:cytochrome b pre-mRNA-processing protein 3
MRATQQALCRQMRATGAQRRMIFNLFGRKAISAPVILLQQRVTQAALAPALYLDGGIPDSFEGRFESLTLHVALVVRRLQQLGEPGSTAAQELIDATFEALDQSIRELGVGDVSVPKKMKTLAKHVYGRFAAYEAALLAADDAALSAALARNATEGGDSQALTAYVRRAQAALDGLELDAILTDEELFSPLMPSSAT